MKTQGGAAEQDRALETEDRSRQAFHRSACVACQIASAAAVRFPTSEFGFIVELGFGGCGRSRSRNPSGRLPKTANSEGRRSRRAGHNRHGSAPAPCRRASAVIERLGSRSSCDGQRAIHVAARAAPAKVLGDFFSGHRAPRPRSAWPAAAESSAAAGFSARDHSASTAEEACEVERDLAGVLVGEVTPEARLPDLPGSDDLLPDVVAVCGVEAFHRRPHGRFRRSVLLASDLGIPPMTLDPRVICIFRRPHHRDRRSNTALLASAVLHPQGS